MIEYSYATINPIRYPQAGALPVNHLETASRFVRPIGNTSSLVIYHTSAISEIAARGAIFALLFSRQSALTPTCMERAYAIGMLASPPKPNALALLEGWYGTDSHQPPEYWDELQSEIAVNRFTLRENGG